MATVHGTKEKKMIDEAAEVKAKKVAAEGKEA